jgi:hypothetical protein
VIGENKMLGIYFSATGNSRYASEVFLKELDCTAHIVSIEDKTAAQQQVYGLLQVRQFLSRAGDNFARKRGNRADGY